MNRTDRLVAMVMYLQGRRVVRAEELARHFEISLRTVYRDVSALSEAGVPVTGEAGVGYSLVKGYHLPPVMFDQEEASALFLGAEMVMRFTDGSFREPTKSAILKLRAVLPRESQDQVERLLRNTVFSRSSAVADQSVEQGVLLPVQRAVAARRVLRIRYRARGQADDTARDIEPLGVVFSEGAWYVIAWCRLREAFRQFRIDRFRRLDLLDDTFPARADFSVSRYYQDNLKKDDVIPARIWISDFMKDRAHRESYATLVEECRRDGGAEYTLFTFSLGWLAAWLLSFGRYAEAIEPPELRDRVCAEAVKVADRYGSTVTG